MRSLGAHVQIREHSETKLPSPEAEPNVMADQPASLVADIFAQRLPHRLQDVASYQHAAARYPAHLPKPGVWWRRYLSLQIAAVDAIRRLSATIKDTNHVHLTSEQAGQDIGRRRQNAVGG